MHYDETQGAWIESDVDLTCPSCGGTWTSNDATERNPNRRWCHECHRHFIAKEEK